MWAILNIYIMLCNKWKNVKCKIRTCKYFNNISQASKLTKLLANGISIAKVYVEG